VSANKDEHRWKKQKLGEIREEKTNGHMWHICDEKKRRERKKTCEEQGKIHMWTYVKKGKAYVKERKTPSVKKMKRKKSVSMCRSSTHSNTYGAPTSGVTRVGHGRAPPNHRAFLPNHLSKFCQLNVLVRPTIPQTSLAAAQPPDI
jgi:hypothetical protein